VIKVVAGFVLPTRKGKFAPALRPCDEPLIADDYGLKTRPLDPIDYIHPRPALPGSYITDDRSIHYMPMLTIWRVREVLRRRATEAAAGAIKGGRPPFGQIPTLHPGVQQRGVTLLAIKCYILPGPQVDLVETKVDVCALFPLVQVVRGTRKIACLKAGKKQRL
jgi:hypothetical protein